MVKFIIARGIGFSPGEPGYIVTHGFTDLSDGGGGELPVTIHPSAAITLLLGID